MRPGACRRKCLHVPSALGVVPSIQLFPYLFRPRPLRLGCIVPDGAVVALAALRKRRHALRGPCTCTHYTLFCYSACAHLAEGERAPTCSMSSARARSRGSDIDTPDADLSLVALLVIDAALAWLSAAKSSTARTLGAFCFLVSEGHLNCVEEDLCDVNLRRHASSASTLSRSCRGSGPYVRAEHRSAHAAPRPAGAREATAPRERKIPRYQPQSAMRHLALALPAGSTRRTKTAKAQATSRRLSGRRPCWRSPMVLAPMTPLRQPAQSSSAPGQYSGSVTASPPLPAWLARASSPGRKSVRYFHVAGATSVVHARPADARCARTTRPQAPPSPYGCLKRWASTVSRASKSSASQ